MASGGWFSAPAGKVAALSFNSIKPKAIGASASLRLQCPYAGYGYTGAPREIVLIHCLDCVKQFVPIGDNRVPGRVHRNERASQLTRTEVP